MRAFGGGAEVGCQLAVNWFLKGEDIGDAELFFEVAARVVEVEFLRAIDFEGGLNNLPFIFGIWRGKEILNDEVFGFVASLAFPVDGWDAECFFRGEVSEEGHFPANLSESGELVRKPPVLAFEIALEGA